MKKRTRSIAAVLMAVLMTVGLIPADFTLVKAAAADATYTFDATTALAALEKSAAIAVGTEYAAKEDSSYKFKVIGTDASKRANMNDYALELSSGKVTGFTFTVPEGNTATVTLNVRTTGGNKTANFEIWKGEVSSKPNTGA